MLIFWTWDMDALSEIIVPGTPPTCAAAKSTAESGVAGRKQHALTHTRFLIPPFLFGARYQYAHCLRHEWAFYINRSITVPRTVPARAIYNTLNAACELMEDWLVRTDVTMV